MRFRRVNTRAPPRGEHDFASFFRLGDCASTAGTAADVAWGEVLPEPYAEASAALPDPFAATDPRAATLLAEQLRAAGIEKRFLFKIAPKRGQLLHPSFAAFMKSSLADEIAANLELQKRESSGKCVLPHPRFFGAVELKDRCMACTKAKTPLPPHSEQPCIMAAFEFGGVSLRHCVKKECVVDGTRVTVDEAFLAAMFGQAMIKLARDLLFGCHATYADFHAGNILISRSKKGGFAVKLIDMASLRFFDQMTVEERLKNARLTVRMAVDTNIDWFSLCDNNYLETVPAPKNNCFRRLCSDAHTFVASDAFQTAQPAQLRAFLSQMSIQAKECAAALSG